MCQNVSLSGTSLSKALNLLLSSISLRSVPGLSQAPVSSFTYFVVQMEHKYFVLLKERFSQIPIRICPLCNVSDNDHVGDSGV